MNELDKQHHELVKKLCKPGANILDKMNPHTMHLLHMSSKLCSEAGELMDAIGKMCYYGKELDIENVKEELGDIEFYLRGLRDSLLIGRDETLQHNIDKLNKRYSSGYSDKAAHERADKSDTVGECSQCFRKNGTGHESDCSYYED